MAAERCVRARQPIPARRALPDVPAHRPDTPGRAGARAGLRFQPRHRDRVLLRAYRRAWTPRAVEPARHARKTVLRRRRDARVAPLPGRDGRQYERARLGRALVRPRGRQRPVRVRLQLHRRGRDGRPLHALPHDGQGGRALTRLRGHLHAQAMERPHRRRRALQHVARRARPRRQPVRPRPRRRSARAAASLRSATSSSLGSSRTRQRSWRSPARPSTRTSA